MKRPRLDKFLDRQRDDGTHQSQGQFTLSTRESLKKLAAYQLKEPGLWLVKVLQFAVGIGASHFQVKIHRDGLLIALDADPQVTAKELWEAILDPTRKRNGPLHHLIVGMRALYGQHDELAWACSRAEGTSSVFLHGESIKEISGDQIDPAGFQLSVKREVTRSERVGRWLGRSLAELDTVKRFCWLAPIQITLDGRELDLRPKSAARLFASWELPAPAHGPRLMNRRHQSDAQIVTSESGYTYWNPIPHKSSPYLEHCIDQRAGGSFVGSLVTLESGTLSRINYVYNGAIIEGPNLRLALTQGFCVQIYAPANELRVDLSEFSTHVRDLSVLEKGHYDTIEMLKAFLDFLEGRRGKPNYERDPNLTGTGAGLATMATFIKGKAVLMGLVGLPISVAVGAGVATAKKVKTQNRRLEILDLTNTLRAAIRQLKRQAWINETSLAEVEDEPNTGDSNQR